MSDVAVPARLVGTMPFPNGRCARTGRPARATQRLRVGKAAPSGHYALLLLGLVGAIAAGLMSESVTVGLPVSGAVRLRRALWGLAMSVSMVAGVVAACAALVTPGAVAVAVAVAFSAAFVVSLRAFLNAWVSARWKGETVVFSRLDPGYAAALQAAVDAAVSHVPPGWYPDPSGAHAHRWWDGRAWTTQVAS